MSARLKETQEEDWKSKYYQAINELDDKEQYWSEEENRLYKSILRLSFAYTGNDPKLDKKLGALREKLRKKVDEQTRKQLINDIIEQILGSAASNNASTPETQDTFLEFLNKLSLPGDTGAEIISLRKRAISLNEQSEKLELLDELVLLLQDTYKNVVSEDDKNNAIELSRLQEVLLQLIEWLPLSGQSEKRLENIKKQLNTLRDDEDVKKTLRQIAALVSDLQSDLQKELIEIEAFLKKVTKRLGELESHIQDVVNAESESTESTESLNTALNDSVRDIRGEIEQATNLDDIKQTISQRLVAIEQNMDTFLVSEQRRRDTSQTLIDELSRRITDMQSESEKLRDRIKDEQEKAKKDALTNIPNRQAYNEQIQQEFGRWQRYGQTLTLCVIDIDKFKAVNDNYGHNAGDKVLSTVAELCHSRVREMDFLARYGGEEFVLLLPATPLEQAKKVADSLRIEVEDCNFHYAKQPVPITISCGLAELREQDTPESLFARADKALYAAKAGGRNCCKDEKDI